ncbi:hypothetical protein ACVVID_02770 [Enterococcus faecalis]|uniref:hypothetical protein n=1 Tax=Enterococcus faecalis TaxID=1351 RepID=UPI0001F0AA0E|nr:hypothetical protein [Enterococcus faecalis]EFU08778.1 hypothetical protein HMPREF9516_01687 [Enterococcus faecalis TX1302]EGO8138736.1 hypothetical protein [Enterococcus faecalis]EGO8801012.1 hypothetical protein [Enterococcus faecalis]EGO8917510.1 hypothetical protein [Enterococcus faecalis]
MITVKKLYQSRLFGAFLAMIALGIALKSNFTLIALIIIGTPAFIVWFFGWDEAKYELNEKKTNKDGHPS